MIILTINSGSSSLKLGLYRDDDEARGNEPQPIYRGSTDAIGKPGGSLTITDGDGKTIYREDAAHESQSSAFAHAAQKLGELSGAAPDGIGYRIVHGGPQLTAHCRITPQVLATLRAATHYAPLHIPAALALIDTASGLYPQVPAFACFDTAFHTTMPPEAFTYAIPARFREQGVRRYGFHGLSYESMVAALAPATPARLVVAHLGNGASLCAIAEGRSVDTSMGLTPTGGIPMGTRSGDLDPGVVLFLARVLSNDSAHEGLSEFDQLESVLNHKSGLAGLSEGTQSSGAPAPGISDLRQLTAAADQGSATAKQAIAIFCRSIAKTASSYAAVLGGLDSLIFTGGIGEHSALVREQVCRQLAFLGLAIDAEANLRHASTISQQSSSIRVRILPADEDGRIAHHVRTLLATMPA
jgi:acetate kinase